MIFFTSLRDTSRLLTWIEDVTKNLKISTLGPCESSQVLSSTLHKKKPVLHLAYYLNNFALGTIITQTWMTSIHRLDWIKKPKPAVPLFSVWIALRNYLKSLQMYMTSALLSYWIKKHFRKPQMCKTSVLHLGC